MTDLAAELFASTGLRVSTALVLLCAAVAPALIILSVVLALSRRIDRLEQWLIDLRQLHLAMQEIQTHHASVVGALGSIAVALPDLEGFKDYLRGANSKQSELISVFSKISVDLEHMHDTVEARLTILQSNQDEMYKVLKAWDARLKDLEQTVAAVPSIRTEQAEMKSELAEWNSRFDAASEVLAEFLQSEDLLNQPPPTFDAPTNP